MAMVQRLRARFRVPADLLLPSIKKPRILCPAKVIAEQVIAERLGKAIPSTT